MPERFAFSDLRELFAKANEVKSGDQLAGIAAASERERVAAKRQLADLSLDEIVRNPLIDPDQDDVSRLILDSFDQEKFQPLKNITVGEFRERLLDDATTESELRTIQRAIIPEIAAAVAKIMSNKDLVLAAARIRNVTRCRNTMGERGVLGIRVQPNHPVDDIGGILLAAFEGLLYGCGDAVIGVNPAADSVETVGAILHALDRLVTACKAPTQTCCLAHISTQLAALGRDAPVDLLFQSVAGTEAANKSFGITLAMLREGREQVLEQHRRRNDVAWKGTNVMYFETGQGSALSAEAHYGVDQLTLEARAYGVARVFDPFLVNSVVGFIGPEYLYDEPQIIRAGLEDHFMGKLLGLPMGCDVCYTNHAEADQNSADNLLLLLGAAGCNYFMGVPCSDDVMLNYQSTSYHDAIGVRKIFGLRPAPEFLAWLESAGIHRDGEPVRLDAPARRQLLQGLESSLEGMACMTEDSGKLASDKLAANSDWPELVRKIRARTPARILVGRAGPAYRTETQLQLRDDHAAARDAVRAELDVNAAFGAEFVERWKLFEVRTRASSKDEYLQHPSSGRAFSDESRAEILRRCAAGRDVQIAIGDGLSVPAIGAQVPRLLPLLVEGAQARGWSVGQTFIIHHCRVGIMNEIGELLRPRIVLLLIGERPGLAAAESLSAYMAYQPDRTHSDANRNLISNIHRRGLSAEEAAARILNLCAQMMRLRVSGVTLKELSGHAPESLPK
jgi:ethanolamine ammonia-lyase large subunit